MFERLTDRARNVVSLAHEEAGMLGHDHIGTGHILLGILHQGAGIAGKVLESLGVTLEVARLRVGEVIGPGPQGRQPGRLPFTPRANKALELSLRESIQLGYDQVGVEHLLLGLVRLGEGTAVQTLNDLGAHPDRVRQQIIQLMTISLGDDEPPILRTAAGPGKRRPKAELVGRIDALEWRLSVLEKRVGIGPGLRDLDREIAQVRRDKERATSNQDFETVAALRDRERQLLADKAARQREWTALPSLSDEVERLCDLLRRHGIDPQDGTA